MSTIKTGSLGPCLTASQAPKNPIASMTGCFHRPLLAFGGGGPVTTYAFRIVINSPAFFVG